MILIRTIIFRLGFWFVTGFYGIASILFIPLPYRFRYVFIVAWANMILKWLHLVCGVRYRVFGKENIPKEACVILSKHSSMWETLALPSIFHMPAIVVKRSLLRIPFFGWMLSMCEPIPIDRKKSSSAMKDVLLIGKQRLEKGRSILIFPEGTRGAGEYKIGGVLLAKKNHRQILPVAHNAGDFWSENHKNIKPGLISVLIGKPIDTQGKTLEELNHEVRDWIEAEVLKLKSEGADK